MQTTANLGLKKPEGTDVVNVQDFNDNADLLDIALDTKAPLASPALTGTPTAPTSLVDTSTTQVATTAFVLGQAGTTAPTMNGAAGVGISKRYARADHVHPVDTSRAAQMNFATHLADYATKSVEWDAKETPSGAQVKADAAAATGVAAASVVQGNIEDHQADYTLQVPYAGVTTGVANTYAIATPVITALTTGMAVSVKINVDSTGASTLNWNGKGAKGIKKSNGSDVTNLKATGIYTLRYDGINFILQGEGGSGNAAASDLLSGKTASTDAGDIVGTMPNKVGSGTIITPSTTDQVIPQGYYGGVIGDGKVLGDPDLIASNILTGKSIFNVIGTLDKKGSLGPYLNSAALANGATSFVDGEGIWVGGSGVANLYNTAGTLVRTVTGPKSTLLYVSSDRMVWSDGSYVMCVTDKNGTLISTNTNFTSTSRAPLAVMHTATDRIYTICTTGSNYHVRVFNTAGTQIGSDSGLSSSAQWVIVTSTGALLKVYENSFRLLFFNSSGAYVNLNISTPLLSNAFN